MAGAYLNCVDVRDSLASPLYALDDESASLPTLLIQVGTRELLLGDSRRFATRAKASGAHVDYVERLQPHHGSGELELPTIRRCARGWFPQSVFNR
jgi:acetyl esterase/lipase